MDPVSFCNDIVLFCQSNGDEATIIKYSKYFKEGYDAYGVPTEIFLAKIDALYSSGTIDLPLLLESAPQLLLSGKYEETSFAIVLQIYTFNAGQTIEQIKIYEQIFDDLFEEITDEVDIAEL